jgi:hypothetical protein
LDAGSGLRATVKVATNSVLFIALIPPCGVQIRR